MPLYITDAEARSLVTVDEAARIIEDLCLDEAKGQAEPVFHGWTAMIWENRIRRRDGRAVDGGGLENHCTGNRTGGSNPSPSATISLSLIVAA